MRIGVISDTHGLREQAKAAVELMGTVDMLLHAGDFFDDAIYLSNLFSFPVVGVRGNCDFAGPREELIEADEVKILLIHGHQYGVKSSLQSLTYYAREREANVAIFGHTHHPEIQWVDELLLFNPGSTIRPRGVNSYPTFGVLSLDNRVITPSIVELKDQYG